MDDRYGGRISRQAMKLNDFYNRQFGNVYVFGGTDLRYRTRLLGKHISKMYESRIPTVVFYNDKEMAARENKYYISPRDKRHI